MNMKRRVFMKGGLAAGVIGAAVGSGLLAPRQVFAARDKSAFEAASVDDAMKALFGSTEALESGDITVKAPDIAENGAVVPVTVSTTMDEVTSISIIAAGNSSPLTSTYVLYPGTLPYISTRLKMAKTASVIAVVKAGGKVYSAKKEVKVTIGGCGG